MLTLPTQRLRALRHYADSITPTFGERELFDMPAYNIAIQAMAAAYCRDVLQFSEILMIAIIAACPREITARLYCRHRAVYNDVTNADARSSPRQRIDRRYHAAPLRQRENDTLTKTIFLSIYTEKTQVYAAVAAASASRHQRFYNTTAATDDCRHHVITMAIYSERDTGCHASYALTVDNTKTLLL